MGISQINIETVEVKLAESEEEIRAAQRLRYRVFYEEYKAQPTEEMARERRDMDEYDSVADHLIVVDRSIKDPQDRIVGTYRLLRREEADKHGQFYTSSEYDIGQIMKNGKNLLELGRSCVLADYRTRPIMQLLWEGLTVYMQDHDTGMLFGCASLYGTDIDNLAEQLSYLHHYHLAPEKVRPRALDKLYTNMNIIPKSEIDERKAFKALPPLIKGYLRVGCTIGEGAVVDHQFNTTDVCIVLPMDQFAERYRNHYARKIDQKSKKPMTEDDASSKEGSSAAASIR